MYRPKNDSSTTSKYDRRDAATHLVVAEVVVAEGQVVHASLAGGTRAERLQHDINDALGRQHVAAHHGSGRRGVQHRALRDVDGHRRETALVEGHVLAHEAPQRVDDRGVRDGAGRIGVAEHFSARASEIEVRGALGAVDRDCMKRVANARV